MAGLLVSAAASQLGFFLIYIRSVMEKSLIKKDRTLSVVASEAGGGVFSGCWDAAPLLLGLTLSRPSICQKKFC